MNHVNRAAGATLAAIILFAAAGAQAQNAPKDPLTINIVDVAGNLALTQDAIESFRAKHPKLVAKFNFTKAPSPELPGKLKAMQAAGRSDIDLVLTGPDTLATGIEQNLWMKILPEHSARFPKLLDNYIEPARKMQALAYDQGIVVTFMPAGPLLEYNPAKVKNPPQTAEELLAWCKANPNKLIYARPANSGPGRTFLMGLPYILKDSNPKDPINGWSKTWAYLKELGSCIEYYPSGTGAVMKELGEGSRDMTVTVTGWDINPRVIGTVPKDFKVNPLKDMVWINDAHYMVIPKGVAKEKVDVLIELMSYMLKPEQQAITYDKGYFYPGPAVQNVPVSLAPAASQAALKEYGRPEYDEWIAKFAHQRPLDSKPMVDAFRKWDQEIGAQKTK